MESPQEDLDLYFANAIQEKGLGGHPIRRAIFLVSELETLCDMEGVDSFLSRYADAQDLRLLAGLLRSAGAAPLAAALSRAADSLPNPSEPLLDEINLLVTSRSGYDFESLASAVRSAMRQAKGDP
jgi:hypothetical protein